MPQHFASWPVDWYDQVLTNGPLPVVAFLHGGGQQAVDFMFNTFQIDGWWQSSFSMALIKAIAYAPQGVSIDSSGGYWNAGNMGAANRLLGVDEISLFFAGLDSLEQFLLDGYANDIQPVTGGANITTVFDRNRLMLVGFSNGGQLAYRLVTVAGANGWAVTALCIFGSTIGGWHRNVDRLAALPANVDWTPTVIPSLFHVHGNADDRINPVSDGPSPDTISSVTAQVGVGGPVNDYARADISGQNSAVSYTAVGNATAGWAAIGGAVPPASIPGAVAGVTAFTVTQWDSTGGAVPDVQVCFALVGGGMAHIVPSWAPETVVEFFQTWGGL